MTIREQIILDMLRISDQQLLLLFNFLRELQTPQENCGAVLAFAGTLPAEEGRQIALNLNDEFNQIEGEW